jgi:hypothetical protein
MFISVLDCIFYQRGSLWATRTLREVTRAAIEGGIPMMRMY